MRENAQMAMPEPVGAHRTRLRVLLNGIQRVFEFVKETPYLFWRRTPVPLCYLIDVGNGWLESLPGWP